MITDKEFTEKIHLLIHSIRLIPKYQASEMDKKVSSYVIEKFKDSCSECKEVYKKKQEEPESKGGILNNLKEVILP